MLPKKKIIELSKKKVEDEVKKQKDVLKGRSPLEKAKKAYLEEVEGTSLTEDTKEHKESDSPQEKEAKKTTSEPITPDLSDMVDKSYDQFQRTSKGLAAAATVLLGETLGIDTSDDSETPQTDSSKPDAASLARKILERKKREKSD